MEGTNSNVHKGFTLIELVVVVAIIGILSLMIIPQFQATTRDAKEKEWRQNCTTISSAITMFQSQNEGKFPNAKDLKNYIAGGFPSSADIDGIGGNPEGAVYKIGNGIHSIEDEPRFISSYNGWNYEFPGRGFYKKDK